VKPFPLAAAVALAAFLVVRRRRLERTMLVGGALLAAGMIVYGLGVIHPPNIEELLLKVGDRLGKWTYLVMGAMAYLETGAFVGFVIPGETAILVGGLFAGQGHIDVVTLIAIVWGSAVAGDVTSFFLGRKLGRAFMERHGPKVHITEDRLQRVEGFFDKHGGKAILVGRFVGLVRSIAPFLAGSSRMPLRRFLPYDVIGAGLWSATFILLGFLFWRSFSQVVDIAKRGAFGLTVVIALLTGIVIAVRKLRDPATRRQVADWLARQGERPLLRPVARLVRRLAAPSRFVWNRVTPGDLGLEVTTLAAVALVGGFVFFGYAHILDGLKYTVGDLRAIEVAESLRTKPLVDVAKVVTWLGALPVAGGVAVVAGAALLARRRALEGLALLAGMGLTVAAVQIAKEAEGRPRPPGSLVATQGDSYPSGHAAYAVAWVAVAVAVGHALPGWGHRVAAVVAGLVVVVVVAATRVYLRAHYFSDVVGGIGLGAAVFALSGLVAVVVAHVRNNSDEHP
jgi:membrane protein DedA with SNARE-associated domain